MFNITDFIMATLIGMIGEYPDFQVREYALNWYSKGKLTEDNLATLDIIIEAQYATNETETEMIEAEVVEEITE